MGRALRILDADIFSYAMYDGSPAHDYAWRVVERGLLGEIDLHITHTTILETYNVLFWFYKVRPLASLLEKLALTVGGLKVVETSTRGLDMSAADNIPLGDGFLLATALKHSIPIIVTNDSHIIGRAPKYGLLTENPVPKGVREKLSGWKIEADSPES